MSSHSDQRGAPPPAQLYDLPPYAVRLAAYQRAGFAALIDLASDCYLLDGPDICVTYIDLLACGRTQRAAGKACCSPGENLMTQREGVRQSIWEATAEVPAYPRLSANVRTGVCVVGAGIAGLSTAYHLAKGGAQVTVLDDGPVGGGESGRTTAQITCIIDKGYAETERLRGADGARLAAASHSAAIDEIERTVRDEQIDCDFMRVDGYLFLSPDDNLATLQEELAAARRAGLAGVEIVEQIPVEGMASGPALRFPNQAQFHVLRYLSGLCKAIERMGGQIYSGARVVRAHGGAPVRMELESGLEVVADAGVLATNAPLNDAIGYSSRVGAHRTYVIGARIPRGSVPPLLAIDTADPYHYVRIQSVDDHDVLLVGGEDHRTGQAEDLAAPFANLEDWTRENFPMAGDIDFRWSGQVLNSLDGLALIGRDLVDPNIYVITGNSGIGMTHSTIGGMLITELIAGRRSPWGDLYDPARLPLASAGGVLAEGANTISQLKEWITPSEVTSEDQIPPDSGAVIGLGLGKAAVYRDPQGVVHRYSALCSHTGCVIGWNDVEKSWDCPCHGSRYDAYGHLLNGPAKHDLDPMK